MLTLFTSCVKPAQTETSQMSSVETESPSAIAEEDINLEVTPSIEEPSLPDQLEADRTIELGKEILVDGEAISLDSQQDIYLQHLIETHDDVMPENTEIENQVITITEGGRYYVTGTLQNVQLRVDTAEEENVTLLLNGVSLTNQTAPAIFVLSAREDDTPGTGSVTLYLVKDSVNRVEASHLARQEDTSGNSVKNDGAISSNVSLVIDGPGALQIIADKEGIETKRHLTIEDGNLDIEAMDDSINASEDNVSHITINGGRILAKSIRGQEGDGMDSNGFITINGGIVIGVAHPTSMDSGLDSDLGITINGGTIAATGNMYDEILSSSQQKFIHLSFSQAQPESTLVVVADAEDNPLFAYRSLVSYTQLTLSSEQLLDGNYKVYQGGEIQGEEENGLFTYISHYTPGSLLEHSGAEGGRFSGRPPEPGEGSTGSTASFSTLFSLEGSGSIYGGVRLAE